MAGDGRAGCVGESTGWRWVGPIRVLPMRAEGGIGIARHALHHPWLIGSALIAPA